MFDSPIDDPVSDLLRRSILQETLIVKSIRIAPKCVQLQPVLGDVLLERTNALLHLLAEVRPHLRGTRSDLPRITTWPGLPPPYTRNSCSISIQRGIGAEFKYAQEMSDGSIVAAGSALPAMEDALKAGWLMRVHGANGETQWQRYFTGNLDYTGHGLDVNQDDVITIMMDAKPVVSTPVEEGEVAKDYARVVTLNPRGVIFDSQAYFQGEVADASDLLIGPAGERILIGTTRIAYQKEDDVMSGDDGSVSEAQPIEKRSLEGWIVATPRANRYEDPCKPKKERVLNSL